jgi:hypothetical protein
MAVTCCAPSNTESKFRIAWLALAVLVAGGAELIRNAWVSVVNFDYFTTLFWFAYLLSAWSYPNFKGTCSSEVHPKPFTSTIQRRLTSLYRLTFRRPLVCQFPMPLHPPLLLLLLLALLLSQQRRKGRTLPFHLDQRLFLVSKLNTLNPYQKNITSLNHLTIQPQINALSMTVVALACLNHFFQVCAKLPSPFQLNTP